MNLLPKIFPRTDDARSRFERAMLRREAEIGGQLFGPVPKGHVRQFFCLDAHTWIWYEEWQTPGGERKSLTTRYDIRPNGILKVQDGQHYQRLTRSEAQNLVQAARLYEQRIVGEYRRVLQTA